MAGTTFAWLRSVLFAANNIILRPLALKRALLIIPLLNTAKRPIFNGINRLMVKELRFALLVSKDLPNQLKMKLQVDKNKCLGCGMCVSLCPVVFELKNGKSQIKEKAALEKYKDCIKEAAENCPAGAIKERAVAQW